MVDGISTRIPVEGLQIQKKITASNGPCKFIKFRSAVYINELFPISFLQAAI